MTWLIIKCRDIRKIDPYRPLILSEGSLFSKNIKIYYYISLVYQAINKLIPENLTEMKQCRIRKRTIPVDFELFSAIKFVNFLTQEYSCYDIMQARRRAVLYHRIFPCITRISRQVAGELPWVMFYCLYWHQNRKIVFLCERTCGQTPDLMIPNLKSFWFSVFSDFKTKNWNQKLSDFGFATRFNYQRFFINLSDFDRLISMKATREAIKTSFLSALFWHIVITCSCGAMDSASDF